MRRKLLIVVGLLAVVLSTALLWPVASYDIDRVLPQVRNLSTPYQSVRTSYYLDGGSIGITIIDRNSRRIELALPVSSDGGRRYPQLFIGAIHISSGATEVTFTEDTRRMLIGIIDEHLSRADDSGIALIALRGSPRDYGRVVSQSAAQFWQKLLR